MNYKEIFASELSIYQKINICRKPQNPEFKIFKDYVDGNHDVLKRQHPLDRTKEVNKLVMSYISDIIEFHAGFLFGNSPNLINQSEGLDNEFEILNDNFTNNKYQDHYLKLATELFSYGEVAELIYLNDGSAKPYIFSTKDNNLSPCFEGGKLVLFIREFTLTEFNISLNKTEEVKYAEVFTETEYTKYRMQGDAYIETDPDAFSIGINETYKGKIPVNYYNTKDNKPIWWEILTSQNRINANVSTVADLIEHISYPILTILGELKENESGETVLDELDRGKNKLKVLEMTSGDEGTTANANYLQPTAPTDDYTKEYERLKAYIYAITKTVDLSAEATKGWGALSGFAIRLMFLGTETKSTIYQSYFFYLSRSLSLQQHILSIAKTNTKINDLNIKVEFINTIPINETEVIENISTSVMSGSMSKETAIEVNPLVGNTESELEKIANEKVLSLEESAVL